MATVMQPPPASPAGGQSQFFNLIIAELRDYELEDAAANFLWREVGRGLERVSAEDDHESRMLEFRDNCSLLGRTIYHDAIETIPKGSRIPETLIRQSIIKLCPGLFPFC